MEAASGIGEDMPPSRAENIQAASETRAVVTVRGGELRQAFRFSAFNALSFQMVLGAPMLLYAKGLGASSTILGLITGLLPLLVILQIPAARHVGRFGYKRFVLGGWSIRTSFVFLIALVPLLGAWLNDAAKLAVVLCLLFLFNAVRGVSSCAWLPWISSIIPANERGRFLIHETAMINLASIGCLVIAALLLGPDPQPARFSALFFVSAGAGVVSLLALRAIPERADPAQLSDSVTPVPLAEMLAMPAFRRLLGMNVAWGVAGGGVLVFVISFLKSAGTMPDGQILLLQCAVFLGGLGNLWLLQNALDRVGSKPVLLGASLLWLVLMAGWALVAGRIVPVSAAVVFCLMLFMGLGVSMVNLANLRLAMTVIPERGRSHFFVVFSVNGNVLLGLAPIGWGFLIDLCAGIEGRWHGLVFNAYTIVFAAMGGAFTLFFASCLRLMEPERTRLETLLRETLTRSRLRHWLRLWPRGQ